MTMANGVEVKEEMIEDLPKPVAEEPPKPKGPKKLTVEERLSLENLFLKIQNLVLQGERLQKDVQESVSQRLAFQEELKKLTLSLNEKYGCDLQKAKVLPDGTILEPTQVPQMKVG